jgi:hypothetical protein
MGKTNSNKASKKKTVSKKKETANKVMTDPAASGQDSDLKTEDTQISVELTGNEDLEKSFDAEIQIRKAPVLLGNLILKKFDTWQPDHIFVHIPDKSIIPDAPPFVSGTDEQDTNRKRALLFKTFDMMAIIADGERIAIEKAAAEKAATEKAEAERIAAEKTATEKAEAERIAAEKAATEKAEAERIAAEKAATEKAEAERIAAEKAATEKAEAEHIAAEKAAAAEQRKKAAELQRASAPKVKITYDAQPVQPAKDTELQPASTPKARISHAQPVVPAKDSDPMDKTIKIAAGCLAFLVLILIGASLCNSQKFYIKTAKNGIEIWQGRFSPKGEKQLVSLVGINMPAKVQKVYSKKDIYPLIFNYFLNKADALLYAPGIPDFAGIRCYIDLAQPYATTQELRDTATLRLNSIAQALLIYKADIAASRGTMTDLESAMVFLSKAKVMNLDKAQAESLDKKIKAVTWRLEQLKAQPEAAATAKPK